MRTTLLILLLAACGDDTTMSPGPDAGTTPPDGDTPSDAPPATVTLAGVIYDLDLTKAISPSTQAILTGVEVCAIVPGEPTRCMTTGADGRWTFAMPKSRKGIGITMKLAGYAPLYNVSSTSAVDELGSIIYVPRDADVTAFFASCNATYPLGTNAGLMMAGYRHVAPNYVALDGATESASSGVGPCYMESPWVHGPDQLTTTTAGYGYAVFGDVPTTASTVDVTVTLAGTTCFASRDAAPLVGDGVIRTPLLPGFFTHLPVVCE